VAATKQLQHVADIRTEKSYIEHDPPIVAMADMTGGRTVLLVPMLKENELVGVIAIYRQEVRPFTDKQIELVKNFASQAVIAIENARLLNELRQSLDEQTATSEVLQVISSSQGDVTPVFNAILENATRICAATCATMLLREGNLLRRVALLNAPPAYAAYAEGTPGAVVNPSVSANLTRTCSTKRSVHTVDVLREEPNDPVAKFGGARTLLSVPLVKDGDLVGVIGIYRQEVRPFTEKQIELVENFAAQAVIAIENARLLNELRQSLEQQTATAEVLQIVSSSLGDLDPVFSTMLEEAVRICDATFRQHLPLGRRGFASGCDTRYTTRLCGSA
jgi:GAF domain-containing protein